MSYEAVSSEKSKSYQCDKVPSKIVENPVKSVTQRQVEQDREFRQYRRKLIVYVEEKLDKRTQKCGPISVNLYLYDLSVIGGYDVHKNTVVQILRDHYEPEYKVTTTDRGYCDIAVNPEVKSVAKVKQTGHACILL